jgi:hypothetical protein
MTDMQIVQKMFDLNFVKRSMNCRYCSTAMKLKKSKDSLDGFNWRCINYSCTKYQTTISLREFSWLKGVSTSIRKILKIILYWANSTFQKSILENVSISKNTLSSIRKFLLSRIESYFERNPIILGGPGVIVQVDKIMLNYEVKSHRGRVPRKQIWCLTFADTSFVPSRCYFEIVRDRTAENLLTIIERVIRSGSIIATDEFAFYQN